jgi:hypothetical protein
MCPFLFDLELFCCPSIMWGLYRVVFFFISYLLDEKNVMYSGNSSITSYTKNKCPSDPGKFSVPARKLDTPRFRAYTYNFEVILTIWFNCPVVRLCHSEVFARIFV